MRGGPMSCEADEMQVVTPVPGGHSTAARQFASRVHRSLIAGCDKVGRLSLLKTRSGSARRHPRCRRSWPRLGFVASRVRRRDLE